MPKLKKSVDKLYFSIGEVAQKVGVAPSQIRFWEKEFDNIKPKKNASGVRFFTDKDVEQVQLVYHLVKERGMTLKGARQKIKDSRGAEDPTYQVVHRLKQIRAMLIEVRDELE
ncbi:MerR family transcriptional regulator [Prolixibacteraceae bacterium JC049]|nr:MerR family transcriptional regulator [Prolixibacteraceae bacterium JC049]